MTDTNMWAKINEMANEMSAFSAILSRVETMLEKVSGTMTNHHNGISENTHRINMLKLTWKVVGGVFAFVSLLVGIAWGISAILRG